MREIKYRGKPKDTKTNGNWVYGSIITPTHNFSYTIFGYYIYQLNKTNFFTNIKKPKDGYTLILCEVEPKTVGQYTGLKDRNGKEIYEGDIVYPHQEHDSKYKYWQVTELPYPKLSNPYDGWHDCESEYGDAVVWKEVEIIGNIYDNPELLERWENDV